MSTMKIVCPQKWFWNCHCSKLPLLLFNLRWLAESQYSWSLRHRSSAWLQWPQTNMKACDWQSGWGCRQFGVGGSDLHPRGRSCQFVDMDLLQRENSPKDSCILMKLPARGMDLVFAGGIMCVCVVCVWDKQVHEERWRQDGAGWLLVNVSGFGWIK